VDEYSSILNLRNGRDLPLIAIGLIVLGGVLLLHTLDLMDFERVARFWPVLLIGAGAYLLYGGCAGRSAMRGNDGSWIRAIRGPITLITRGRALRAEQF